MELPPVAGRRRHRRQRAAGDRAERLAPAEQREHAEEHQHHRHGVGEEARHHAGVGEVDSLVVLSGRGRAETLLARVGSGPGGLGDPTPLRDVGRLAGRSRGEVGDEVEAVAVGEPRRRQQSSYGLLSRGLARATTGPLATSGEQVTWATVHREHSGELVEGLADRADAEIAQHPEQGAEEEPDVVPGEGPGRDVGQRGEERGPTFLVVGVAPGQRRTTHAAVGGLRVEHHRPRHHQGAVAGQGGPPAEVDVVAEDRQLLVEPAERLEDVALDQHAGGVDREHLTYGVVLALVVLPALQAGLAVPGAGDGQTDLQQPAQRGPLAQLGAEDRGVRVFVRGRQQLGQRCGGGVAVVVEQPDPLVVADVRPCGRHQV